MTEESKCPNCGAPLTQEKCEYCAHVAITGKLFSEKKDKKHRYYISFGNEGFNVWSDLPMRAFMAQFVGKDWMEVGNTIAGNIRFDLGSTIHLTNVKYVKEYFEEAE